MALEVGGSSPLGHPSIAPLADDGVGGQTVGCRPSASSSIWQSNGLLIRWFWVRVPGGAPQRQRTPSQPWQERGPLGRSALPWGVGCGLVRGLRQRRERLSSIRRPADDPWQTRARSALAATPGGGVRAWRWWSSLPDGTRSAQRRSRPSRHRCVGSRCGEPGWHATGRTCECASSSGTRASRSASAGWPGRFPSAGTRVRKDHVVTVVVDEEEEIVARGATGPGAPPGGGTPPSDRAPARAAGGPTLP